MDKQLLHLHLPILAMEKLVPLTMRHVTAMTAYVNAEALIHVKERLMPQHVRVLREHVHVVLM